VAPRSKPGELVDAPIIVSDCTTNTASQRKGYAKSPTFVYPTARDPCFEAPVSAAMLAGWSSHTSSASLKM
jgi:hypothetical protein